MRRSLAHTLLALTLLAAAPAAAEPGGGYLAGVTDIHPQDQRHRLHMYVGGELLGFVTALQHTGYEQGYLGHFGGGMGAFAGVRLGRWISLEANWTVTLHDDGWGRRYEDQGVLLNPIYAMAFTADAKLHVSSWGPVEPFIQGGLGLALMGAFGEARQGSVFSKGLAFNLGAGLDVWVHPLLSLGGRMLFRGMALGQAELSVDGIRARNLVSGLTMDVFASLHF